MNYDQIDAKLTEYVWTISDGMFTFSWVFSSMNELRFSNALAYRGMVKRITASAVSFCAAS